MCMCKRDSILDLEEIQCRKHRQAHFEKKKSIEHLSFLTTQPLCSRSSRPTVRASQKTLWCTVPTILHKLTCRTFVNPIYLQTTKLRLLWPAPRCRSSRLWDKSARRGSSKESAARDRNICVINPSCVWDIRGRIRGTYLIFQIKSPTDRCTSSCDVQEQSRKVEIRDFVRKSWCVGV